MVEVSEGRQKKDGLGNPGRRFVGLVANGLL